MSIIDSLITEFKGDDASYVKATNSVVAATQRVQGAISHMVKDVAESLDSTFRIKEWVGPLLLMGSAGGFFELGKSAIETSNAFDVLERKLAGVTGSFQRAKAVMSFAEGQSTQFGLFSPEELDKTATMLEGFGLQSERVLPIVELMATTFGEGASSLDEFARALGRIAEGSPGRAMMILANAGIGVQQLKAAGVQFKGNMPTGDPSQIMSAIQTAVTSRFGGVMADTLNSPEARMQAIGNAWDQSMRQAGDAIKLALMPYMDVVSRTLNQWVEGGLIGKVVGAFTDLLGLGGGSNNLSAFLTRAGEWLNSAPDKIRGLKDLFHNMFSAVLGALKDIAVIWAAMWAFNAVTSGWRAITAAIQAAAAAEGVLATIGAFVASLTGGWAKILAASAAALAVGAGVALLIGKAQSDIDKLFHTARTNATAADTTMPGAAAGATGGVGGGAHSLGNEQLAVSKQIEKNTRQAAIDLRAYALGGSGRPGVSAIEVQAIRRGGRGHRALAEALDDRIHEIVGEMYGQGLRQRYS